MIPGDLLSAFPHRQFHTLPGLLDSWAALPNSNPNACMPMQGGSLYHFYDGLWYDPAERRTHDLPCERRTRYRLSQPDTVHLLVIFKLFEKESEIGPILNYCECSGTSLLKPPLLHQKSGLSRGVASRQGLKSIHLCFDLHCHVAFPEKVASYHSGFSKEAPLYNFNFIGA